MAVMVDKPAHPFTFDVATLARMACPACYGDLRIQNVRLLCVSCDRAYPILNGIPVLIMERAETIAAPELEMVRKQPAT